VSGHSKWSTIKRKKEATDAKRSNMYAKLLRAVEVAAREGGGSIEGNMTLASAVDKAREFSVPTDNIERAIKRGTGEVQGAKYEEVTYEGYAPGGVAILVEALTDNRNRTSQEVRHTFSKQGGNLGDPGSTAWMFARKAVFLIEKDEAPDEEQLLELALEAGAEDLSDSESAWEIRTEPGAFRAVKDALDGVGRAHDGPAQHRPGRGIAGQGRAAPARGARGSRRRPGRLGQLRHPRDDDGRARLAVGRRPPATSGGFDGGGDCPAPDATLD
jgi:YebC/PmpR family DNA-binding regulatory protein